MQITLKFRLRDSCNSELTRQSRAVNLVWNYCNETQKKTVKSCRKWLSWHDLQKLTAGSSKELGLHAHTIQQVCQVYDRSRCAKKKPWLRWRVSKPSSPKRSLGWVPFNGGHVVFKGGVFVFRGRKYKAWVSRKLQNGQTFCAGSFSQDNRGRWFINLPIHVSDTPNAATSAVGVDLGLKDLAALSNGKKIAHPRLYRNAKHRLAVAQRARKKKQVKKIHAKVKAQRHDHLHKLSTQLVQSHAAVFVGNVNAGGLAKTRMAKSVLDAGWSSLRTQLAYKAIRHRAVYQEVNEAYSTQTCSLCFRREGPKGFAGLGVRQWQCSCGAVHDRDINAAKYIAALGLESLEAGAQSRVSSGESPGFSRGE